MGEGMGFTSRRGVDSAGLTHKRTKRALRAPSCKGAPSKIGRKLCNNIHFKEYKFKQRSTKKYTSALLKWSLNKSSGPLAVDYNMHGVDSLFCMAQ